MAGDIKTVDNGRRAVVFGVKPIVLLVAALCHSQVYAESSNQTSEQVKQCESIAKGDKAKAECHQSEAARAQLIADAAYDQAIAQQEYAAHAHIQLAEAVKVNTSIDVSPDIIRTAEVTDEGGKSSNTPNKINTPNNSKDSKALNKKEGKDLPINIKTEEVKVRAKRFYDIGPVRGLALTKEEIPGNVQSITAKEIKESKALSLTDLMNSKLQSVNVNDYQSNPFQMDVTYRGFTASPQLGTAQGLSVFLDGIRVNEPFGDVVNWDMLPLNALGGLDVFPGSNPLFGLGTLGGALSMKTKSGFDANEGTVEFLGGSFNRKQFQGSVSANNGVIAGFAAANIFKEDGWRDNSPSEVNQIFGKAEWRNDNLQIGLSTLYAGNKLVGNGLLPTEIANDDRSSVFTSPDETKNRLLQFQLSGIWDVSDTFNISGQIYKRKSRRNASTGDVNQDFSGAATRRPNPGERISPGYADIDNDGLPDPGFVFTENVAVTADGFFIDINGEPQFLGFDINGIEIPNPAYIGDLDPANLAVGSNFNSAMFAIQGTRDVLDAQGNVAFTVPAWGINPNSVYNPPTDWVNRVRQLIQNYDGGSAAFIALSNRLFPTTPLQGVPVDQFNPDPAISGAIYVDAGGFATGMLYFPDSPMDANGNPVLQAFSNTGTGLGKPLAVLVFDATGQQIQRNGADCGFIPGLGTCRGYIDGTPTALITETEIDQTTDGAALQLNWNLEKHKFMVGASIDAADASYESGQYLGLFDDKRNAYRDPNKVGYEFAAASTKLGLNDFAGNSTTKSLYFSETWTPKKEWALTAAGRFNYTNIKNELAINNFLGLRGPMAFKNFFQQFVLCPDSNGDSTIDFATECPTGSVLPFSVARANGLGAIGKGETEKFTYRSFNPAFGATWQPTEALNLYGNWNRGARTPSVIELGCAFDDTPVLVGTDLNGTPQYAPRSLQERRFCSLPSTLSGDPYLKQVRSETLEFGGRGYLTPDIQWNASIYQTDLTDDIYFVSFTPERSFFQNIGNTRRRGVEMGVQGKWNKWGFRASYSLTDATFQDKFRVASPHNSSAGNAVQGDRLYSAPTGFQQIPVKPGDRMPGVPLHNLNATLSYDITPDWTIGLTGILHSESFIRGNENNKHRANAPNVIYNCNGGTPTIVDGVQYGNDTCGEQRIRPRFRFPGKVPGYAVFNFNTSYKITKGLTASLLINNVFDREYYTAGRLGINPFSPSINGAIGAGGFNYNSNDWLASTFLAPGAPRSGFFTLTYDFDMGK